MGWPACGLALRSGRPPSLSVLRRLWAPRPVPVPSPRPALATGSDAFRDGEWAGRTRETLKSQAAKLDAVLVAAGFAMVGGTALFRLGRHSDAKARHAPLARPQN